MAKETQRPRIGISDQETKELESKLSHDGSLTLRQFVTDFVLAVNKHDLTNVLQRHKKSGKTLGAMFADALVNQQRDVSKMPVDEALALLVDDPKSKKPGMLEARVIKAVESIKAEGLQLSTNRIHVVSGCNKAGIKNWIAANRTMVDEYNASLV